MYAIGELVSFGRPNGEKTQGVIVKIGPKKLLVEQVESRGTTRIRAAGTRWSVPPSLCVKIGASGAPAPAAPVAKRPDAYILSDIQGCYNSLSPENLSCDGELSPSECLRRATAIKAKLRTLLAELGRPLKRGEICDP